MELIIKMLLGFLDIYFLIGVLFGLYSILKGAIKIDPLMTDTKKWVKVAM